MPQTDASRRRRTFALSLAVTLATWAGMLATSPGMSIAWDEGYTLGRLARLRVWFRALDDPKAFASTWSPPLPDTELVQQDGQRAPRADQVDTYAKLLLEPAVVRWFWPFARAEPHGHPPFYALVGLVGDLLVPAWDELPRARVGPILLFGLTAGALFWFFAVRNGYGPAFVAASAWSLQPQLFGHGHYATYDAILTSLWVMGLLTFDSAVEETPEGRRWPRWRWVLAFGLVVGCALDTKLTGWFLPLPCLVWVAMYRDRKGLTTLLVGLFIAAIAALAMNPLWWVDPIGGLAEFFRSNLTRGQTRPIPVLFLGQVYMTPNQSLPYYNTLVWTILAASVGFLALALAGVLRSVVGWKRERFGILVAGHWAFLLLLRALPHVPGHDGIRQFLPAFGMIAPMAGLGAVWIGPRLGRLAWPVFLVAAAEGLAGIALMMPVPLSYFSPIVGGLPGATRLGMEPTYYWDALDDETLRWLDGHTGPTEKVRFATYPTSWLYLREIGRLNVRFLPNQPGAWAWYVLQNRPGAFSPIDRLLVRNGTPAHVVTKLGVPLVWVFPYSDVEAAQRRQTAQDAPR
ncbi:glycosyltransferase family 39 protein [Isosphaeraceae bacterium EP7]